ncbi:MAG: AAA family ATPase [Bacteroidetes bacterium]|nr:AAA family ATPase [Bacteroidota bacterium]
MTATQTDTPLAASLPGRTEFLDLLSQTGLADTGIQSAAFVIIDIKGLGNLNLKYGSSTGDQAIEKVALWLINRKPKGTKLFRLAGDEFILYDHTGPDQVGELVQTITATPVEVGTGSDGKPVTVKLNAASAISRSAGEPLETVYFRARQLFSKSKKLRTPIVDTGGALPETYFFPMKSKIIRRQADLDLLNRQFRESLVSKGSILFIEGQAGIGKTKLISQFLSDVRENFDPTLLLGMAHHARIPPPHHLIRRALSRFLHQNQDRFYDLLNRLSGVDIREIYQIMPELDAERLTRMDFSTPGQHYDFALFDSLIRFLDLVAETGPLVIWFEDFHDADAGSWNFLRYLSGSIASKSIFILITAREIDFENPRYPQSMRELFYELRNQPSIRFHRLQPFTLEETAAFCHEFRFFRRLPPKGVEFIYQISKGNPLYIVELAKYLVASPRLIRKIEKGQTQEGFDIPTTIQDIVLGELSSLTREEMEFTRFLSVLGFEIHHDQIGWMSGRNEYHVQSLVDALKFKNVIADSATASHTGVYHFSHPMVRSVVYNAMSMKKRRGYHRQVADMLEKRTGSEKDISHLADHYYLAAEWDKSYRYALDCAVQAKQVYDYETAFLFFSRAREIAKIQRNDANFADMVQKEGEILQYLGRNDEAFKRLTKSAKLMEARGNQYGAAYNLLLMAQIHSYRAAYGDALNLLTRAKKLISGNVSLYGMLLGEECWIYRILGDYERSIRAGEEALDILLKSSPKRETGMVYSNLGEIFYRTGDLNKGDDLFRKRLDISRSIGDRESEALALYNLAKMRLESGRGSEAGGYLAEAWKIASEIGSPLVSARVLVQKAQFALESGDTAHAHHLVDEAFGLVDRSQFNYLRPQLYILRAQAYLIARDVSPADKQARSALSLASKSQIPEMEGIAWRVLADCQLAMKHDHDAVKSYEKAIAILSTLNHWQADLARRRRDAIG